MKQLQQNLKTGQTTTAEIPIPNCSHQNLLIQTTNTLVSLGTERMLVEFGQANLLQKARQQPEKVKQVFDKIKTDGLQPTLSAVQNKLEQPITLGYCNVGKVLKVGDGVTGFKIGDRVASNGHHAQIVSVPQNLAAHIPDNVSDETATFTVIGAIGLQGIRLAHPTFGETIVVIGLGLIGLITIQLLKANGCNVIGIDVDDQKLTIAQQWGINTLNSRLHDPVQFVIEQTGGIGADAVLITASTKGDTIISQATQMSRKRGRIVLVGVVGLNMNRSDFYKKELSFQVSCSYGPGRYDDQYEQNGQDYPIGFVRWTEQRNFKAILHALSNGQLDVKPLVSERIRFEQFHQIYEHMDRSGIIGSILVYGDSPRMDKTIMLQERSFTGKKGVLGIIGAGNFTSSTIIPALTDLPVHKKYIASAGGLSARILAEKGGFNLCTSDYREILNDPEVDLVFIATRHHQHAKQTLEALKAGKHVFVEKPLALTRNELQEIAKTAASATGSLTVGFNRRHSHMALKLKELMGGSPAHIVATINAGFIPSDHWIQDPEVGGGRIIGEACHFIDLCTFFTGSLVEAVAFNALGPHPNADTDNGTLLLHYKNGSNAVINYFANGAKSYPKEKIEVFSQGRVIVLDNWRKLTGYGTKGFRSLKSKMDKGHHQQFQLLIDRVQHGGAPLITLSELINTSEASIAALEALLKEEWIHF